MPSYDEAYTIPSEEAALLSVRTQQIIAYESGVANVIDPLAGSYFVESLTDALEAQAEGLLRRIDEGGGLVAGIERGEIRREIMRRAYEVERQTESGERVVVGVNAFTAGSAAGTVPAAPPVDPALREQQIARLRRVRAERDPVRVASALETLRQQATGQENLMPAIIEAVAADATIGEVVAVLRGVFGEYRAPSVL